MPPNHKERRFCEHIANRFSAEKVGQFAKITPASNRTLIKKGQKPSFFCVLSTLLLSTLGRTGGELIALNSVSLE